MQGTASSSALKMIASPQFTLEMAINYLHQWKHNPPLVTALLQRIQRGVRHGRYDMLTNVVIISSQDGNSTIIGFCEALAIQSLQCYLLLRWAYRTYTSSESLITSLDTRVMNPPLHDPLPSIEALKSTMRHKEMKMNYLTTLNQFYQELFHLPHELKDIQNEQRQAHLKDRLCSMLHRMKEQEYSAGVWLPLADKSMLAVRVVAQKCTVYPTKDRVPFKIVLQTIDPSQQNDSQSLDRFVHESSSKPISKTPPILPHTYFGSLWHTQTSHLSSCSPYSNHSSYQVRSFMIKAGDDLRQQHLAMQLIRMVHEICIRQNVKIWLRPYLVIPFDKDAGMIEFIEDTRTLSFLKEKSKAQSLKEVFLQLFGNEWQSSLRAFVASLAGYSLVQYLFQIKDRHNNNILLDSWGHLLHIDFAFIIRQTPGNVAFEKAPFKLTQDYLELMGGTEGDLFHHFKLLLFLGLKYVGKYRREIVERVEMMRQCSDMACFKGYDRAALEARFMAGLTDQQLQKQVQVLVNGALQSRTTTQYDVYQWVTNQIYQ